MTWPRPTPEALAATYGTLEYYATRNMDGDASSEHVLRARQILERSSIEVSRALDFGAGEGHLVAALRSLGVDAVGVEPSAVGRQEARRRYGIELWEALPQHPPGAPPELVVLMHSLEHVADPVAVLRTLAGWLAPGGAILLEVPNAVSFEMWFDEGRRQILDLPVHLYHFTPDSLSRVVETAGLQVVDVSLTNPAWLERMLARRAAKVAAASDIPCNNEPTPRTSSLRQTWRGQVLPWIRACAPGWKFQLLAKGLQ